MPDAYQIDVAMNDDTLAFLNRTGQSLVAYKGVKASIEGGLSTVWFKSKNLGAHTYVKWSNQFAGYVTATDLKPGVTIEADSQRPMDLGNILTVQDSGATAITRAPAGEDGDIVVKNAGKKLWTAGMGQIVGDQMSPLCGFELGGSGYSLLMMPYEQVLLVFMSGQTDTGTVVEETLSASCTITLTGAERSRQVSFDLSTGWDAKSAAWATISPDSINIAETLIHKF